MEPIKCHLALKDESQSLFSELNAESLRQKATLFNALEYTPQEEESVRSLVIKMNECAAMGFTHIEFPNLSTQLEKSLVKKGFWVCRRYKVKSTQRGYGIFTYMESNITIGWIGEPPEISDPWFSDYEYVSKMANEANLKEKKQYRIEKMEDIDKLMKDARKSAAEFRSLPYEKSGCLSLFAFTGLVGVSLTWGALHLFC